MGEYTFSLLDVDYSLSDQGTPIIRMFGRTTEGKSIVALDPNVEPYFYALGDENAKSAIEKLQSPEFEILKIEPVTRKYKGAERKMLQIFMKAPGQVPIAREVVRALPSVENIFEADILFNRRYLIDNHLMPMSMVRVQGEPAEKETFEADEVIMISSVENTTEDLGELRVMGFDIEAYSPTGFPQADADPIIMISAAGDGFKKVFTYKKNPGAPEYVEVLEDERGMLKRFLEFVREMDVDIFVGYNSDNFDMPYIQKRCEILGVPFLIGRSSGKVQFKSKGTFSAAQTKGRVHTDLYHYVNYILRGTLQQLGKRTLKNVAAFFLKEDEGKKDISHEEIGPYWEGGGEKLNELFEYSLTDSIVTWKLSRLFLPRTYELAKLVRVPLFDSARMTYGQLVEAYLIWRAFDAGEVVPNRPAQEEREERAAMDAFEGAYVKDPERGMHENVALFDFRSLYPTIIISHNIDYSTIDCACCEGTAKTVEDTGRWFCEKRKGLMPTVLNDILEQRTVVKKDMKSLDKDSEEYVTLDSRQYALKIIANSAYGYLAYRGSRWYTREGGRCVTSLGRMYVKRIIDKAAEFDLRSIYGDSVTGDRFVTVKNPQGIVQIKNIEGLFEEFAGEIKTRQKKEVVIPNGYQALTMHPKTLEISWKPIQEVIRHKTNKKIFRVAQKYGETVVTQDHGLMVPARNGLRETKPEKLGKQRMARINRVPIVKKLNTLDLYDFLKGYTRPSIYKGREKIARVHANEKWVWFGWTNQEKPVKLKRFIRIPSKEFESLCKLLGAYIAEGSASTQETSRNKFGASIAGPNKWLKPLKLDYERLFVNATTKVIPSTPHLRHLKYKTERGQKKELWYEDTTHKLQMMNEISAVFFKELCGQKSRGKKLPDFIFHAPEKYQRILLEKFIEGDGTRLADARYTKNYKENNYRLSTISLHLVCGLSFLLTQLKQTYTIRYRKSKGEYVITTSTRHNARLETRIKKEPYDGYVYDLHVPRTNTFVDSCGQIVLHNTDSLFVVAEKGDIKEIAPRFMNDINKELPGVMELEFEGVYTRGIFVSKKRYALIDEKERLTIKGLEFVRKDWSPVSKETQQAVIETLLREGDAEKAFTIVREVIKKLQNGEIPIEKLAVYTELTRPLEKYLVTAPHVAVAKKLKERGENIRTGTSIGYVITKGGGMISERAKPVDEVKESQVDTTYYVEHQLVPAVSRVMEVLGYEEGDLLGKKQMSLGDF